MTMVTDDVPLPKRAVNARVKTVTNPAEGPSDLPSVEELQKLREEIGIAGGQGNKNYVVTETFGERTYRKFSSNPFVPIGCLVTAGMLTGAMVGFHRNDKAKTQFFLRGRVGAQGLTLAALLVGVFFFNGKGDNSDPNKRLD